MTPEEQRTLDLFEAVESRPDINQRQLAEELGISLGMANAFLKMILSKGWIRARKVKARRWLYFLTPKGALEKSRLSLSYLHRTLNSFRELKSKGDEHLRTLSKKGVRGIHLCGDNDLTEVLSYCFSGFEIELLSVIPEKDLLDNPEQSANPNLPELKSGELILLASMEHRAPLAELLAQQGLQKNQHWVLFS